MTIGSIDVTVIVMLLWNISRRLSVILFWCIFPFSMLFLLTGFLLFGSCPIPCRFSCLETVVPAHNDQHFWNSYGMSFYESVANDTFVKLWHLVIWHVRSVLLLSSFNTMWIDGFGNETKRRTHKIFWNRSWLWNLLLTKVILSILTSFCHELWTILFLFFVLFHFAIEIGNATNANEMQIFMFDDDEANNLFSVSKSTESGHLEIK